MNTTTSKVLGSATYTATWVARSNLVKLTAIGILPCSNYVVQLEQRPERVTPPNWNLVFFVEETCEKGLRPFAETVHMINATGATSIIVHDAVGEHEIPIQQAFEAETLSPKDHMVYARLPRPETGHNACLVVPADSMVTAIHYRAFGPATKQDCERFVAETCNGQVSEFLAEHEKAPWPLVV